MKRRFDTKSARKARAEENLRTLANLPSLSKELTEVISVADLKEVFRMHPWQLIRLYNTSKAIRKAIVSKEKEENFFWYHICKHSFPDICIALYEDKHNPPNPPFTGFFMDRVYVNGKRGLSFSHLDRSFTADDVLEECTISLKYARDVELCFKALYPFGVPPSQYFFASQWDLNQVAAKYYLLIDNPRKWSQDINEKHTVKVMKPDRAYVTLNSLMTMFYSKTKYIPDREFRYLNKQNSSLSRGRGPYEEFEDPEYVISHMGDLLFQYQHVKPKNIYTFRNLCQHITKSIIVLDESTPQCVALKELRRTVYAYACIYDIEAENDKLFRREALGEEQHPSMTYKFIENTREDRLTKYGTIDPLVKDMIIMDEISMREYHDNNGWREIVKNEIDWVKKYRDKDDQEYTRISSKCFSCDNTDISVLHIEESFPFNFYCGEKCRDKEYQ